MFAFDQAHLFKDEPAFGCFRSSLRFHRSRSWNELPFLGSVPLDPAIREGGDSGRPMVLAEGSETADALRVMTENVANNVGAVHRRRVSR